MARLSALLTIAVAAVAISAKPIVVRNSPVTLPIARRVNLTGTANVLKADQARAKVLKGRSQASKKAAVGKVFADVDVPVTNTAVIYTAGVGVGTPPTTYNLIIDTGSSNTWVGADSEYVQTSSSVDTGDEVVSLPWQPACRISCSVWKHRSTLTWGWGFRKSVTARASSLGRSSPIR